MHMGDSEFDDDVQVVGSYRVAMLTKLVHNLVGPFSVVIVVKGGNNMLKSEVAVIDVFEYLPQKGNAVSDCC